METPNPPQCPRTELLIEARVDGTLNEAEFKELSEHLKFCALCAEKFYLAMRTEDTLKNALIPNTAVQKSSTISKANLKRLL